MKSLFRPLLALALTFAATSAFAQEAQVTRDARCLLAMAAIGSDPNSKIAASLGVFYYAGRIRAREPSFDFSKRLRPLAEQMRVSEFEAEARRCGEQMTLVSKSLDAAETSLSGVKPKP